MILFLAREQVQVRNDFVYTLWKIFLSSSVLVDLNLFILCKRGDTIQYHSAWQICYEGRYLETDSSYFQFHACVSQNLLALCCYFIMQPILFKAKFACLHFFNKARRTGSDGSMSASGSAGPGFDPLRGSKFSFENFQPRS